MWLRRDLTELRWKNKVYGHWKWGMVAWEDCRDAIYHYREKSHVVEAQLELKLASAVGDNKKCFSNTLKMNRGPKLTLVHYCMGLAISKTGMQSKRIQCLLHLCLQHWWWILGPSRNQEPQNWDHGNNNLLAQTQRVWDLLLQLGIH